MFHEFATPVNADRIRVRGRGRGSGNDPNGREGKITSVMAGSNGRFARTMDRPIVHSRTTYTRTARRARTRRGLCASHGRLTLQFTRYKNNYIVRALYLHTRYIVISILQILYIDVL